MIRLTTCTGEAITAVIPALAALRCEVFRTWPYLYDGDEAYERRYLQIYVRSAQAAVIVARDGSEIVGASTCLPLTDETEEVRAPFQARGIDAARVFYFGESVLRRECRGQGVGVGFFNAREAHARAVSACDFAAFASVVRPADHPTRPPAWQPLDGFWTKRGYIRRPDLICHMSWKELDEPGETEKPLMFWMKSLSGAPLPPMALP
jgi:GNAT superfamily N-acetyltransferase